MRNVRKTYIKFREKLVVNPPVIEVHPPAIGVHPFRNRCTPPYTAYTSPRDRLSDFLNRLSFYLYRLSEREKSAVSSCLLRRRLSRKIALFVSEKALYSRVLFVEDYRGKELFLLVKKHCIFAFFSYAFFVEDYREKELFLLVIKHCILASSS